MANEIPILYENENFYVVEKPWGWLTTPARHREDPRPCLGLVLQNQTGGQIYPVHRLDFAVSGIVLWAKNANAHRIAQAWFETGTIQKTYQALSAAVNRQPPREWTVWKSLLAKGKRRAFEAEYGKPSETRARVLEAGSERWHWELMPVTGRPHQLRFEMAKQGHPVLGDQLYGAKTESSASDENAIALRAVKLDFTGVGVKLGLPNELKVSDLQWPPQT